MCEKRMACTQYCAGEPASRTDHGDWIGQADECFARCCRLSILADKNGGEAEEFTGVASIVKNHWKEYGRNFYSRYDYEDVDAEKATQVGDLRVIPAACTSCNARLP